MDVVVIGGGLSGLAAAASLRAAGAEILLLEAGSRIGGRIHALRVAPGAEVLADLGPTWVWPKYQPVVARWLDALGIATFEQFNAGDAVILGYAPTALRQPLPGQDGMVRIAGGPSALVDALARRIGARSIRTSAPVAAVTGDGPQGITVELASGEVVAAPRAIVSMPLRVAAGTLRMPWASPVLLEAMRKSPTWMSTHAKAVALYDRPFWRDAGLSGRIASRDGPLFEAHDHSGPDGTPAAIFGFVGWPPAARRRDPEGLRTAILGQLSECFGPAASRPLQLVVQDWATDPRIVTELDLAGPATHPETGAAVLRQPHLGGRLRFAVSEASEISPGLIEGALSAGEHAAIDILRAET